jgi:hypothetical protein
MRPLRASECISPAIERTKLVLFRPFMKGRSWKLAATAQLTTMGWFFFPWPLAILALPWFPPIDGMSRTTSSLIFLGCWAIFSVLFSGLFYIGARLEFALFEIVLLKASFVAPLWRKYGLHTRRWVGLKIAYGTIACAIVAVPVAVWVAFVARSANQTSSSAATATFFLCAIIAFFWICLALLISSVLGDFILPHIALEDMPLKQSIRRAIEIVKTESRQVVFFALMKIVIAIVGVILQQVATLIVELIVFIPLGLVGLLGWLLLHNLGVAGQVPMFAGGILLELIGSSSFSIALHLLRDASVFSPKRIPSTSSPVAIPSSASSSNPPRYPSQPLPFSRPTLHHPSPSPRSNPDQPPNLRDQMTHLTPCRW